MYIYSFQYLIQATGLNLERIFGIKSILTGTPLLTGSLLLVLGWAMVLGSFQCQGVLLLLHIVGQGPTVLAAGAEWVDLYFPYVFPF